MKNKEKFYTKATCLECDGTGENGSYAGQCWKCKGEKFIYLEVPANADKQFIEKVVRE